jgi:hypothetical protein
LADRMDDAFAAAGASFEAALGFFAGVGFFVATARAEARGAATTGDAIGIGKGTPPAAPPAQPPVAIASRASHGSSARQRTAGYPKRAPVRDAHRIVPARPRLKCEETGRDRKDDTGRRDAVSCQAASADPAVPATPPCSEGAALCTAALSRGSLQTAGPERVTLSRGRTAVRPRRGGVAHRTEVGTACGMPPGKYHRG